MSAELGSLLLHIVCHAVLVIPRQKQTLQTPKTKFAHRAHADLLVRCQQGVVTQLGSLLLPVTRHNMKEFILHSEVCAACLYRVQPVQL